MAARRELLEETGYEAVSFKPLGQFVTAGNQRGNIGHVFHVVAGQKVQEPNSGDLEETETVLLDRASLVDALVAGDFKISSDISALAMALLPQAVLRP
jgi:ADP-ribose pyrophosphatase